MTWPARREATMPVFLSVLFLPCLDLPRGLSPGRPVALPSHDWNGPIPGEKRAHAGRHRRGYSQY